MTDTNVEANPPMGPSPNPEENPTPVPTQANFSPPAVPPENEFVNRAALGYTSGQPPYDENSNDNNGMGIVNPPPHMQERAITREEWEARNAERTIVHEGSNLPTTPETAQANTLAPNKTGSVVESNPQPQPESQSENPNYPDLPKPAIDLGESHAS